MNYDSYPFFVFKLMPDYTWDDKQFEPVTTTMCTAISMIQIKPALWEKWFCPDHWMLT